jgi:hypothetical protein
MLRSTNSMVALLANFCGEQLERMSCPDNSYSIRMRRLKQKQDALYARNTTGSQLMQPFNYNISPTGNMGNQFMLGTVAGSKNEVNTSPFGKQNEDIACICTVAVEAAEAGPIRTVGPNITLMVSGSVFGFANYDATRVCIFKVDTSGVSPTVEYQKVYNTLPTSFSAYLMEKGTTNLYVAGYSGTTTYLIVVDSATGNIIKQFTYTNQPIIGISEIGTDLYITSTKVDYTIILSPVVTSYIDIYDTTNFNASPAIRTFANTIIRGKIWNLSTNYYAIVYEITGTFPTLQYNIKAYIWSGGTLNPIPTNRLLISNCTASPTVLTNLTFLVNSPTTFNTGSNDYLVFADIVNGFTITSPPAPVTGLNFFGYNITSTTPITPVRLDSGTALSTPNISNLVNCNNAYYYVLAGTTTSRIYGINISGGSGPFTAAITPSPTTQYTASSNQLTTDNISIFRFEFNGTQYTFARYAATANLSGGPAVTANLVGYTTSIIVIPNTVYDPTASGKIFVNDSNASVGQYDSTTLAFESSAILDAIPI